LLISQLPDYAVPESTENIKVTGPGYHEAVDRLAGRIDQNLPQYMLFTVLQLTHS